MMSQPLSTASEALQTNEAKGARTAPWERLGILYVRIALGSAFLSPVADRFGLWGKHASWGNFANFTRYVAQVNSFMPAFTIPFLAWAATAAETTLGILLILGIWPRWVALGSAILLFLFGDGHGDFFWYQVAAGLFRVFRIGRSAVALALPGPQVCCEFINRGRKNALRYLDARSIHRRVGHACGFDSAARSDEQAQLLKVL